MTPSPVRSHITRVGLGQPPVGMTEPSTAERNRYLTWMLRHRGELVMAFEAAEELSRAYDRAAVVTRDGNPDVPVYYRAEISVHLSRWEERRWAGQRKLSGPS